MAAEGAKESGVKAAAAEVPSSQVPTGRAPLTRPGAAERAARTPAPAKAEPAADLFDLLRLDEVDVSPFRPSICKSKTCLAFPRFIVVQTLGDKTVINKDKTDETDTESYQTRLCYTPKRR